MNAEFAAYKYAQASFVFLPCDYTKKSHVAGMLSVQLPLWPHKNVSVHI